MELALPDVFDCPLAWSCPQVFNSGLGMRLCGGRFDKELFSCRIFLEFQSYSRHRNHFDIDSKWTHSEEIQVIPMERFSEVMKTFFVWFFVKNIKWHLVGHKRFKFQFEDYWEPLVEMWSTRSDIWLVIKGLNFNLRVIKNRFQSIHFICMNNDFISHEKALSTNPDCLPLIRKGLIRHVM